MAKKRVNGEGSIRRKPNGRWEGRYTLGIQIIRLEEVRSEEEQAQHIEAIAHPLAQSSEENYIQKETLAELY